MFDLVFLIYLDLPAPWPCIEIVSKGFARPKLGDVQNSDRLRLKSLHSSNNKIQRHWRDRDEAIQTWPQETLLPIPEACTYDEEFSTIDFLVAVFPQIP